MTKYLDMTGLNRYNQKLQSIYVSQSSLLTTLTEYAQKTELPKAATSYTTGLVKPDGLTITVDGTGTIKANLDQYAKIDQLPIVATTLTTGLVKPDDKTIKVTEDGTINAELGEYIKGDHTSDDLVCGDGTYISSNAWMYKNCDPRYLLKPNATNTDIIVGDGSAAPLTEFFSNNKEAIKAALEIT